MLQGETFVSAKQAIKDKLQGSVATYLRCGGVYNNQIKKRFIAESVSEPFLKSANICQSYKQERDCLVHSASGQYTAKRRRKCTRQSRCCL